MTIPGDTFRIMLEMQRQLQQQHMKDGDPMTLQGFDRCDFIQWNAYALEDEIHEATGEVGWKRWATSNHVNHDRFMGEMVDAFHFFMNMLLAGSGMKTTEEIVDEFYTLYRAKNAKNAQRQVEGYDGVYGKCPHCHRDLAETNQELHVTDPKSGMNLCSAGCRVNYNINKEEASARAREEEERAGGAPAT